ncbi:hypothetical protein GF337_18505 [candidate division KSB1 bacterium]|nr:hypothetical protein [candidate division KSB1 bacterium]
MVDINLIGDDDDKGQHENDDFSNEYNADSGNYSSESEFSDSDLDHSLYDRSYTQSKSKKTAFIIFGILAVAAIAVVVFIVMNSSKKQPQITEEIKTESVKQPEVNETPAEQPSIPEQPAVNIPPFVRENISSTRRGIRTVETILATIPQNVNFTMIKYRDGSFLTEFLGRTSNNISEVNSTLQQRFPNGNVKVISRDRRSIEGNSYQQALLNGSISVDGTSVTSMPNFLSANEVKNQFREYCQQFGLSLNKFEINQEMSANGYKKVPVLFHAVGTKDALLNFLNRVIEANLNVNLSKIVFITSDILLNSNKINLILNMEIYNQ